MSKTAQFQLPTQDDVHLDLRSVLLRAVHVALTAVLEEELERMIGAGRSQRSRGRRDQRNGSYSRGLLTSMGQLEVAVPRSRSSGSPVEVLGRYKRRASELDDAICSAYVNGVSTRKMGEVTEGRTRSPSLVRCASPGPNHPPTVPPEPVARAVREAADRALGFRPHVRAL